jgi:ABC-type multidrug transport system fused ATPase/permease subunit
MKEILKIFKNYKFVKKEFFSFLFFWILMESLYVIFPQFSKKIVSIIENKWSLEELYLWLFYLLVFAFFAIW